MRRTPLKRVSAKRAAEGPEYDRMVQGVLVRDHFACVMKKRGAPGDCGGRLDPHHVWPVGEGGPRLDAANVISACRLHHMWAHNGDRKAAAAIGCIT